LCIHALLLSYDFLHAYKPGLKVEMNHGVFFTKKKDAKPLSHLCTQFQQKMEVVFTVLKLNMALWYHFYMPAPAPTQLLN
jgi:hypothetical protein